MKLKHDFYMTIECSHPFTLNQIPLVRNMAQSFDSHCLKNTCSTNDFLIGYLSGKILNSRSRFGSDIINIIAPHLINNTMKWIGFCRSTKKGDEEIINNLAQKILKNAGLERCLQQFSNVPMSKHLWHAIFSYGYKWADIETKEQMIRQAQSIDSELIIEDWELIYLKTSHYCAKYFKSQLFHFIFGCVILHLSIKCFCWLASTDFGKKYIQVSFSPIINVYKRYYLIFYTSIYLYIALKSIFIPFKQFCEGRVESVIFNSSLVFTAVRAIFLLVEKGSNSLSLHLYTLISSQLDFCKPKIEKVWKTVYDSTLKPWAN